MVSYKIGQQVGEATIAEARKETGTEDISRCCKGGDGGRRFRFRGLSASGSHQVRGNGPGK